jgi:mono/diheme cytochrome c family protein
MRTGTKVFCAIAIGLFVGLISLGLWMAQHGFSAREKPSRLEEFLARHARKITTPAGAKALKNPYPVTPESLRAAQAHWVDHCASCHGLDGSANTPLGQNMYPQAPDMRDAGTQGLSDGELYYIISNGVRFTGMPAWGSEHTPEETWQLVSFIRRLPHLTPDELKAMKQMAAGESVGDTEKTGAHTHTHGSGTKTHSHHH